MMMMLSTTDTLKCSHFSLFYSKHLRLVLHMTSFSFTLLTELAATLFLRAFNVPQLYHTRSTAVAQQCVNSDISSHWERVNYDPLYLSLHFFQVDQGLASTSTKNVSILDFIEAKDDGGGGNNWSYNTCKAPVKLSPPTNQHPAFYRQMSFLLPNQ